MTSSIKILTTSTLDSTPSIVLIAPNGKHTLINCGEGCQRSFLDTKTTHGHGQGLRVRAIERICLTQLSYAELGGLPGLILTSADADSVADKNSNMNNQKITTESNKKKQPDLEIIGPQGSSAFVHSLRHFMRRDNFLLEVKEGCFRSSSNTNGVGKAGGKKTKKRKQASDCDQSDGSFHIQTIPISYDHQQTQHPTRISDDNQSDNTPKQNKERNYNRFRTQILSFIFRTPPVQGKFDVKKAIELGIPKGPLFARLKNGQAVKYVSTNDGLEKTAFPEQVMMTTNEDGTVTDSCPDGVAFSVICCPNLKVLQELIKDEMNVFQEFQSQESYKTTKLEMNVTQRNNEPDIILTDTNKKGHLDCMIHLTPIPIFHHSEYQSWRNSFGTNVKHLLLPTFPTSLRCNENGGSSDRSLSSNGKKTTDNNHVENAITELINDEDFHAEAMEILLKNGRSPYNAAFIDAMSRNIIHEDLYSRPYPQDMVSTSINMISREINDEKKDNDDVDLEMSLEVDSEVRIEKEKMETDTQNSDSEMIQIRIQKTDDYISKTEEKKESDDKITNSRIKHANESNHVEASPFLEYVLIPRAKKGLNFEHINEKTSRNILTEKEFENIHTTISKLGATLLAKDIVSQHDNIQKDHIEIEEHTSHAQSNDDHKAKNSIMYPMGELTFTGTGSAIPSKHRNVTGNYLQMKNGNALLLDVGEGTTGQLLRTWSSTKTSDMKSLVSSIRNRISNIKAIWISHPHADHHLGLLRLLSERRLQCPNDEPPILIAPMPIFRFLEEYSNIDPILRGSYEPLDCRFLPANREGEMNINPYIRQRLFDELGITQIHAIPVAHCAHAYAILITGTMCPFGKQIAYSGDCRPSNRLATVGKGADLLIHEATFEDGMEEEALLKRHSTVSEAIGIGAKMDVKYVVLTHFSQRYPKIPEWNGLRCNVNESNFSKSNQSTDENVSHDDLSFNQKSEDVLKIKSEKKSSDQEGSNMKVIFAFDYMTIKPSNIELASKITPAMRLLYPSDGKEEERELDEGINAEEAQKISVTAKEILSKPGLFADSSLL